jgi:putative transposase
MERLNTASHTQWECKYHVVFIPKYRRKVLYGELRKYLGDVFRKLALQKESRRRGLTMRHWSAVFSPAG